MKFTETSLKGAYLIEPERVEDERGFFARSFCQHEFADHGLISTFVQCNISFNNKKGTLRGMHYQTDPFPETKLVRCTRGKIFDVIIDLRPESVSFKEWFGVELSAQNRSMLYIPNGFAHGFQTLSDEAELFYQMSEFYHPECARGVRWNDGAFAIDWPLAVSMISEKDQCYALFMP